MLVWQEHSHLKIDEIAFFGPEIDIQIST